jgi:hypothetical protein
MPKPCSFEQKRRNSSNNNLFAAFDVESKHLQMDMLQNANLYSLYFDIPPNGYEVELKWGV